MLYRSPDRFQFLAGLNQLLPQELDGQYPSHWRVNHSVLQQVRQLVAQMEQQEGENDLPSTASREILFMQLLLLLRKSSLQENLENSASRLNLLLAWLEDHFADEVNWDAVADQFSLSLRTLHRQLKQQTGLTPQRYLNRLRLMKARHLLRHSEASVTPSLDSSSSSSTLRPACRPWTTWPTGCSTGVCPVPSAARPRVRH